MKKITIDGNPHDVDGSLTVLEAAEAVGISIPTLCRSKSCGIFTSCMLCVVEDRKSGRLFPSCSSPVEEGMDIATGSPNVLDARRTAVELLLGEHLGDCDGPCTIACAAHLDIPAMIRHMAGNDIKSAARVVLSAMPIPAILGRICPAPCEKACRRSHHDSPVSICMIKRFIGDRIIEQQILQNHLDSPSTGRKIAVIGSGPTGMAAAFYLASEGHRCTVFEKEAKLGTTLRKALSEKRFQ